VVADVREVAEVAGLKEGLLEELAFNRLLLLCCTANDGGENGAIRDILLGDVLPSVLCRRSEGWDVLSIGMVLSELHVSNKNCKDIFRRLRLRADGPEASAHYRLVTALHLAGADVGRDALQGLTELLASESCALNCLDLSHTNFDGYELVQSLRGNSSLTSLDVRFVNGMDSLYETLCDVLMQRDGACRLGCLRCDAVEVPEGVHVLSLKEHLLGPIEMGLVVGLLRHNTFVHELDLTATDMDSEATTALAHVLAENTVLTSLTAMYNPAMGDDAKDALRAAASVRDPALTLQL